MTERDNDKRPKDPVNPTYTAMLPSDFHQTIQHSLTQSLVQYYPPVDEITPELRELLGRLDETKR